MRAQQLMIFSQIVPTMLCLILGSKAEASPSGARAAPMDPEASWAASYLVSTVMVREYEAVLASLDQSQQNKSPPGPTPKDKSLRSGPSKANTSRDDYLVSAAGQALWVRGQFGLLAMAARRQQVSDVLRISSLADEHQKVLVSRKSKVPPIDTLRRAATEESESTATETSEKATDVSVLSAALAPLGLHVYWPEMEKHFVAASLACPIAPNDVSDAATVFHNLLQESGSEQSTSPARMLSGYANWQPAKIRCLALHLATLPQCSAAEHLVFLMALRQSQGPYAKDVALSALTAQRLIEAVRYPEALAILLDLSDQDRSFRLPYELLQRIFSARQKGRGAVALQGL
jgi:hypothetical protein